jgi:hypothetical protein
VSDIWNGRCILLFVSMNKFRKPMVFWTCNWSFLNENVHGQPIGCLLGYARTSSWLYRPRQPCNSTQVATISVYRKLGEAGCLALARSRSWPRFLRSNVCIYPQHLLPFLVRFALLPVVTHCQHQRPRRFRETRQSLGIGMKKDERVIW